MPDHSFLGIPEGGVGRVEGGGDLPETRIVLGCFGQGGGGLGRVGEVSGAIPGLVAIGDDLDTKGLHALNRSGGAGDGIDEARADKALVLALSAGALFGVVPLALALRLFERPLAALPFEITRAANNVARLPFYHPISGSGIEIIHVLPSILLRN